MGGFQSREAQLKDVPTVSKLLGNPGLTVNRAGTIEQVTATLRKRFEASIGGNGKGGDEKSPPKKVRKLTESDSSWLHRRQPAPPSLNSKLPPNTEVVDVHLFASGVPITRESVDALVALGVRTIVSFTVMPLEAPRAMHVNLSDFDDPGFMDRDPDMLDGLFAEHNCTAIHMPCNDAGTLSTKQVEELLGICTTAREKDEAVLLHCWSGSRRTWAAARIVKRVLDSIPADEIHKAVIGKQARSNRVVDTFLSSPTFPAAPSSTAERLQLLALAAALQSVTGGGGLYSKRIHKKYGEEHGPASMFRTYWPSITFRMDDQKLEDATKEIETTCGITKSKSREFPRQLQKGWKAFADSVLLRACSEDKELASSIINELLRRGPEDVRDEVKEAMGDTKGFLQDKF